MELSTVLNATCNYKTNKFQTFKLTYIGYDQIKGEVARMDRVEYNTYIGGNIMDEDDIE